MDEAVRQQLDAYKDSFLWAASKGGRIEEAQSLIEIGGNVDWFSPGGDTCLLAATRSGHEAVVALLCDHGADVSCCTKDGQTPLHLACQAGKERLAALLLERGCSPTATDASHRTAFQVADAAGHSQLARRLKSVAQQLGSPSLPSSLSWFGTAALSPPATAVAALEQGLRRAPMGSTLGRQGPERHRRRLGLGMGSGLGEGGSAEEGVGENALGARAGTGGDAENGSSVEEMQGTGAGAGAGAGAGSSLQLLSDRYDLSCQVTQLDMMRKLWRQEQQQRFASDAAVNAAKNQSSRLWKELIQSEDRVAKLEDTTSLLRLEIDDMKAKELSQRDYATMELVELQELETELQGKLSSIREAIQKRIREEVVKSEQRLCVVCQEAEKAVLLLPCRHLCLCQGCASKPELQLCPLCRTPFTEKLDVYS